MFTGDYRNEFKLFKKVLLKKDISKYSAIPPQTPAMDLFFEDFLNSLFKLPTPFYETIHMQLKGTSIKSG